MAKAFLGMRLLFTAVLAVVLTLGPCASVGGVSGAGKAHAHELSGDVQSDSGSVLDHGRMGDHAPVKNNKQRGCAEMCNSWAIHKSVRDLGHAVLPDRSPSGETPSLAILAAAAENLTRKERLAALRPGERSVRSNLRLRAFALTNRYRL